MGWGRDANPETGAKTYYYRPQTTLWEGNVFTPVCDSVHWGGVVSVQGVSVMEIPHPPVMVEERVVSILLECILVYHYFCGKLYENE